jgi:hypothetical protein
MLERFVDDTKTVEDYRHEPAPLQTEYPPFWKEDPIFERRDWPDVYLLHLIDSLNAELEGEVHESLFREETFIAFESVVGHIAGYKIPISRKLFEEIKWYNETYRPPMIDPTQLDAMLKPCIKDETEEA